MSSLALSATGLSGGYGRVRILFDVDLSVATPGVTAVLGRNGAGKSTLLKVLIGELPAMGGDVKLGDVPITRLSTERRVRAGIAYVPQDLPIFSNLSVRDNLKIGAGRSGGIDRAIALFPKLGERLNHRSGALSGGERKMVAIGRAILSDPKILLLDEPTEGVWSGVIDEIGDRLSELARDISIILVEQHLDLAFRLADRIYVMDRGHVAFSGAPGEVRSDPRLLQCLSP